MIIFTEVMAKLVTELVDHGPTRVSVTEDSVTIECGGVSPAKAANPVSTDTDSPSPKGGRGFKYDFNGKSLTVREWAELYGVPYKTMAARLLRGSPETQVKRSKSDHPISKQ